MENPKYRGKRYYVNPYENEPEYVYGHNVSVDYQYKIDDSEPNGFIEYESTPCSTIVEIDDVRVIKETLQYSIDGSEKHFENVMKPNDSV